MFTYGATGLTLWSSVTLEGSLVVPDGLYLRVQAVLCSADRVERRPAR